MSEASRRPPPGIPWMRIVVIALLAVLARVAWNAMREPRTTPVVPQVSSAAFRWTPISEARARAKQERKPILYDFNAAWCPPCRMLAREVFDDPGRSRVVAAHVVPVTVVDRYREDGRNPSEVDDLQRRFGVEVFPTLVLLDPETGRSEKAEGYLGADGTLEWITKSSVGLVPGAPSR